jgi:hypothetical protein
MIMIGGVTATTLTDEQRQVLDYAEQNADTPIALAIDGGASSAAAFIIDSDAMVIGMGGFGGEDPAPTVDQLAQWVADGTVAFVLGSAADGGARPVVRVPSVEQQTRQRWIEQHCTVVDPSAYGGRALQEDAQEGPVTQLGAPDTLYHC